MKRKTKYSLRLRDGAGEKSQPEARDFEGESKIGLMAFIKTVLAGSAALFVGILYASKSNSAYYTYEQVLGPLSDPTTLTTYTVFTISLVASLVVFEFKAHHLMAVLILALIIKFIAPQYFDFACIENFYDAYGHMIRGSYVTLVGHSDPRVDDYFDLQPAFFWWTAIFVNILFGPQSGPDSYVFAFLVKWFSIVVLAVYLPILVNLFKKLGLSFREALIGYVIFALMSLSRYHYSAQVFSWTIYWLLLSVYASRSMNTTRVVMVVLACLTSLVFIHQGTSLFTLTTLMGILAASMLPAWFLKINVDSSRKNVFILSVTYLWILWLGRLIYLTMYTFGNFANTFESVVETLLEKGVPEIIADVTARPYEKWYAVVAFKSVYMSVTIIVSALILLRYAHRGEIQSKILLAGKSFFVGVVSLIALALGGVGYVERVYDGLLPVITYSLIKGMRSTSRTVVKNISTVITVVFSVCGGFLYFAGWNFQSRAYSEYVMSRIINNFGPSITGIYSKLCVNELYYPYYPYRDAPDLRCLYAEVAHKNILAIYYLLGDYRPLKDAVFKILSTFNLIYSSQTAYLYTP